MTNNLTKLTIEEYLAAVDSPTPTPGGGSVSALVNSLAASLVRMYGHLSITKKAFINLNEETKAEFIKAFTKLNEVIEISAKQIDNDALAYGLVMSAYQLPSNDEKQKQFRNSQIQQAIKQAIQVPLIVCQQAYQGLSALELMINLGNKNVLSDAIAGAYLFMAGYQTSLLNIKINLAVIQDRELINRYTEEVKELDNKINPLFKKLIEEGNKQL